MKLKRFMIPLILLACWEILLGITWVFMPPDGVLGWALLFFWVLLPVISLISACVWTKKQFILISFALCLLPGTASVLSLFLFAHAFEPFYFWLGFVPALTGTGIKLFICFVKNEISRRPAA